MGTGIEAVGDAVSGGALARVVEPDHGEAGAASHGACLNCGTTLTGAYCHGCGQRGHVHRTLGAFVHDLLHGIFHFEGKVWHTLPDLAIRPGRLTRDYIDGKRARYVSPLALFLFMVFLMFAVVGWTSSLPTTLPVKPADARKALADVDKSILDFEAKIAQLEKDRAQAAKTERGKIDTQLGRVREQLDEAETGREVLAGVTGRYGTGIGNNINTGNAWLDAHIKDAAANPKLLIYKLKASAYKYAWAIIPLSVPFVALLFVHRRRFGLYDHAVFVTYSLCAMSLLLVIGSLLSVMGVGSIWLFMVIPVHFFLQLRGTYGLGVSSALWRTIALLFIALMVMSLFAVLLVGLGLF